VALAVSGMSVRALMILGKKRVARVTGVAVINTLIKLRPALETSRAALERSSRTLVNTCSVTSRGRMSLSW